MTREQRISVDEVGGLRSGMTREQIVALFKRRQDAWDDLDAKTLAADYADEAVIESPSAGTHPAKDAERVLRNIFGAFMDLTMTVDDLVIDGDVVVAIMTFEGTHMREFLGLEPTGKRFEVHTAFAHRLKDGKIVHERRIYDFTGFLVQIGLLKARPN